MGLLASFKRLVSLSTFPTPAIQAQEQIYQAVSEALENRWLNLEEYFLMQREAMA